IEICINTEAAMEVTNSTGGLAPYTFNWTFEGTPVGQGEAINPIQTQTGVYCVTMTDACTTIPVNACFEVLVEPVIVPQFAADTTQGCVPQTLGFTILNDPETYAEAFWIFGNGQGSSQFDAFTTYAQPGSYTVSLELTTPTGCVHETEVPGYIRVWPNPVAGFFATPQPANLLDTEITFQDQSSDGVIIWDWIFGVNTNGGLGASNEQNPIYEFPLGFGGEYPVRLVVTDANNCTGQVTKTIVINELLNVFVPNAFTPNNDGVNDVLFVHGTDIDPDRYELRIFNRWGQKVFESTNINEPWDGSVNNGDYYGQNEVYTWQLIVYSKTTVERYELNGSVVVMR
ncbi:MAG: gliding motility-associated C-terminal domain-containing protein, partial [Flavobacteriales bacterium]